MNFSMMIGLAVGIDYSLFIVSRYREERVEGKDALAAIENTMSTAGKAVFLSALTVVMALAAVFLVPVMVFRSMALGMILSVVAVALASLTLLPAVLVALGDRVLVTQEPRRSPTSSPRAAGSAWTGVCAAPARPPCSRSGSSCSARSSRPRSACTSACPAHGRRHRAHQPRRLRHARRRVRSRRCRARVHHDAGRGRAPRWSRSRPPYPAWSTRASSPPPATDRPRRRARHRLDPGRRLTRPRPWSTRLRTDLAHAVPDAHASADRPRRTATSPPCSPDARRTRSGSS